MKHNDYVLAAIGTFIHIVCEAAIITGALVALYLVFC